MPVSPQLVSVTASATFLELPPDSTGQLEFTVFKGSADEATYSLSVSGTLPWAISLPLEVSIEAGASASFNVAVTVPAEALPAQRNDLTILVENVDIPSIRNSTGAAIVVATPISDCTPTSTTLCLNDERFRLEVTWQDFDGNTGSAQVAPAGTDDSGIFYFFDPNNWEMLVKLLNGCDINDRYWLFSAATTNVKYTLRVTDTQTGEVKDYFNPLGTAAAAITDTGAFATCP